MGDFGKILDKWDGERSRPSADRRTGSRLRSEQHSPNQMNKWLDLYPPEDTGRPEDTGPPEDTGSPEDQNAAGPATHRPNPEKLKIDDTLDLHGYRVQEALEVTGAFIEASVDSGYRKVLVIHGKGENGQGVLRREIRTYLEQHPMTGTMGYGRGAEGGRGALWVILRERSGLESVPDRHRSR